MFFGIMNLPAIFQAIMNEILKNIINKEKVAVFVDDVLVGTKTEKGYNKIVKKVLKRLNEDNLYVKLKKCIWKIQKIGFLKVIIEPNRIKMKKEKVNKILSQPKPKNIKNIRKFLNFTSYYREFIKDFA